MRRLAPLLLFLVVGVPAAGAWTWPVQGPVVQGFSFDPAHPYAGGAHRGVDVGADAGVPVLAPAGGAVSYAGTLPTSGVSVTIETGDGFAVTLTHLGTRTVSKGDTVAEGDAIGTVGPSGTPEVDGTYVHLGIRLASDPNGYLDPISLLPVVEPAPASDAAPTPRPAGPEPQPGGRRGARSRRAARRPEPARPAADPADAADARPPGRRGSATAVDAAPPQSAYRARRAAASACRARARPAACGGRSCTAVRGAGARPVGSGRDGLCAGGWRRRTSSFRVRSPVGTLPPEPGGQARRIAARAGDPRPAEDAGRPASQRPDAAVRSPLPAARLP